MIDKDKQAEPVAEILQARNTQKILNWLQDWSHLPSGSKLYNHSQQGLVVNGETSDGYHTFNELYEFRKAYNAALFNEWAALGKCSVHKSWRHHDGGLCFGGGWFIVVAVLPEGQISNHYEAKDWELFNISSTERALFEFDGHTGSDVLDRLKSYTRPAPAVAPQHPDDVEVDKFAGAMKEKLALARDKGRGGWEQCDPANLSAMLYEHVQKGDPRDVANFCMFLWSLGQPITPCAPAVAHPPAEVVRELVEALRIVGGNILAICKERDIPVPHSTMRRIDAALTKAKEHGL